MEENGIVPDAIDTVPPEQINVAFPHEHHGHHAVSVRMGDQIEPIKVILEPTVTWDASADILYTVTLFDLDAPSRETPTFRSTLHWLIVNVPGKYTRLGDVLCEYSGPKPPPEGGLHRYVVLVYAQSKKMDLAAENPIRMSSPDGQQRRKNFSIRDFAKSHGLGEPQAGMFFLAGFDDYSKAFWTKMRATT